MGIKFSTIHQNIPSPTANEKKDLTLWQKAGILTAASAAGATLVYLGYQLGSWSQQPGNSSVIGSQTCPPIMYPDLVPCPPIKPSKPVTCLIERIELDEKTQKLIVQKELDIAQYCGKNYPSENPLINLFGSSRACSELLDWDKNILNLCRGGKLPQAHNECNSLENLWENRDDNKQKKQALSFTAPASHT